MSEMDSSTEARKSIIAMSCNKCLENDAEDGYCTNKRCKNYLSLAKLIDINSNTVLEKIKSKFIDIYGDYIRLKMELNNALDASMSQITKHGRNAMYEYDRLTQLVNEYRAECQMTYPVGSFYDYVKWDMLDDFFIYYVVKNRTAKRDIALIELVMSRIFMIEDTDLYVDHHIHRYAEMYRNVTNFCIDEHFIEMTKRFLRIFMKQCSVICEELKMHHSAVKTCEKLSRYNSIEMIFQYHSDDFERTLKSS
jgi:hypothetical protein